MTSAPGPSGTLIRFFEVTPDDGEAILYRALRSDVEFRFVAIGPGGEYEVVHEEGAVDQTGGTVHIRPFEVPPEDDDEFIAAWHEAQEARAGAQGFLGTRLYRAAVAEFRFVEIARWSSPLMVARASAKTAYPGSPVLYEVVPASPKRGSR